MCIHIQGVSKVMQVTLLKKISKNSRNAWMYVFKLKTAINAEIGLY